MSEVSPFTIEETVAINAAKLDLQTYLKGSKAYEMHSYHPEQQKIVPTNLSPESERNVVVAGGCIASFLLKEQINDIDVFILNNDIDLFEDLMTLKTGPWVVKWFFEPTEDPRQDDYKNENILATATNAYTKIQYILTDYTSRKELLNHFDFVHATASYYEGKLFIHREAYDSIMKKQLVRQHNNIAPKQWRVEKYRAKNWKTEEDALIEGPTKTLKDILRGNLENLKKHPVDGWTAAGKNTHWYDNMADAMVKGNATYSTNNTGMSLNDDLNALFDPTDVDPYLQTR
jgi:hypothetical protein